MSRQSRMVDTLDAATELLTRADNALPGVLAVIAAEHSGAHLQAQSYDGVRVAGFTTELDDDGHPIPVRSDPVGRRVADGLDSQDLALARIETKVREIARAVEELTSELTPWQATQHRMVTPRDALAREAAEAALEEARLDRENEPCCRSCARGSDSKGRRIHEPEIYRRGTVGGRLEDPCPLCRWCYRKVEELGALPPPEWVERHHRGETLFVRDLPDNPLVKHPR